MPRRAMKEMGLEACCLWCDAPDVASLQRCTSCIGHHKFIRDKIAKSPPDDAMAQFGKELMIKAGAPHKHDHLEEHGPVLLEQQKRAAALVEHLRQGGHLRWQELGDGPQGGRTGVVARCFPRAALSHIDLRRPCRLVGPASISRQRRSNAAEMIAVAALLATATSLPFSTPWRR